MKTEHKSLRITATIMCAALYAVGSYITSYIVSPWGVGQFRPAIVIPSLFAVVFGPWPAGVGAAIGTLIADSANVGGFNMGSLIAAVPGNFFGFYLMGWYLRKKFTWGRFITASVLTLVLANFMVAVLYVGIWMNLFMGQLPQLGLGGLTVFIVGLTVWWFVTMLPFAVLVTPPLIRAVVKAFPYLVDERVSAVTLKASPDDKELTLSLAVPAVIMLGLGLVMTFSGFGVQMAGFFGDSAASLIEIMSYASAVILGLLALAVFLRNRVE